MFKDIIYNNLGQGLQFGSRWILNLALISLLDIESYGVFSFIYSLSNILYSILPFGSGDYLIAASNNPKEISKKFVNSVLVVFVLCAAAVGLYLIVSLFTQNKNMDTSVLYGIVLGFILAINLVIFSYFKAIGNFKKELHAYSLFCVLLLLFTGYYYFIVKTITDFTIIFKFLIVVNMLMTLYAIFSSSLRKQLISEFRNTRMNIDLLWNNFNLRFYFGLQEIVTALYTQVGLLLLFYFLDTETYGYYRALFVMISPVMMVTVAISQVILKYLRNTSKDKIVALFRRISLYTIGLGVLVSTTFGLLKGYIFDFIKIETNQTTQTAFFIIVAVVLLRFIFFNYEVLLVVFDKQKERFLVTLIAVIISAISIFLLLPEYGLIGAVCTNLIANTIVAVGLILISERYIKKVKQ